MPPPLLFLLLLFSPTLSSSLSSLSPPPSESSALLSLLPTHHPNSSLCSLPFVQCTILLGQRHVTHLTLESLSLLGPFPTSTLSLLPQLRLLSLKNNSLSGPIGDLSSLSNLKALFLNLNSLSGPFPLSLLSLRRLRTLDLSHNSLSGEIPPSVAFNITRLYTLRLEFNHFSGRIPPFNSSSLTALNFSFNSFSGAIPVTRSLLLLDPSAFSGNPNLCGEQLKRECSRGDFFLFFGSPAKSPSQSPESLSLYPSPEKSRSRRWIAAAAVTPAAVLLIGLAVCAVAGRRRNKMLLPKRMKATSEGEEEATAVSVGFASSGEPYAAAPAAPAVADEENKAAGGSGGLVFCGGEEAVFTADELMKAAADLMGKGTAGSTYKAAVTVEMTVSVKRIESARMTAAGRESFERHVEAVGRLRHPNIVPLRAYFHSREERLLVYEYQANGSLFSLIHGSKSTRSKAFHWTSCLKIAEDAAQGLAHIHQASGLVHGNLKSSNILLGDDFEARLVDGCLVPLLEPPSRTEDRAYRAPETLTPGNRLTAKSDIYAFGVLLLELLAGKAPPAAGEELETWVRSARDDGPAEDERVMMLLSVAAACVRASPDSRPTAWQVMKMLQEVKEADAEEDSTDTGMESGGG